MPIRVTVWSENRHEQNNPRVAAIYPEGIHGAIAGYLATQEGLLVRTSTLDEPSHGLTAEVLDGTDVLLWWGHIAQDEVSDEVAEAVCQRVLEGMGLIVLHSACMSKVFTRLIGTTGNAKWREGDDKEMIWVTSPGHPIAAGLGDRFTLPIEEMYGEAFDVPKPMETIFISWFSGGEVFRSGVTWQRGRGRIFYFRPGHETLPTYRDPSVLRVLTNAVRWSAGQGA